MERTKENAIHAAVWTTAVLALARLSDVWITFRITPDLAYEQNPVVLYGGAGWTYLFWVNGLLVAVAGAASYYYWLNRDRMLPSRRLGRSDFATAYYFGERRPWHHLLTRFPKRERSLFLLGGFVPFFMVFSSLCIDIGHLLAINFEAYRPWHSWWVETTPKLVLMVAIWMAFAYWAWTKIEMQAAGKRDTTLSRSAPSAQL